MYFAKCFIVAEGMYAEYKTFYDASCVATLYILRLETIDEIFGTTMQLHVHV